jgi:hypothetical protein
VGRGGMLGDGVESWCCLVGIGKWCRRRQCEYGGVRAREWRPELIVRMIALQMAVCGALESVYVISYRYIRLKMGLTGRGAIIGSENISLYLLLGQK